MTFYEIYQQMQWTREPERVEVKDGMIAITTKPHTDLWQRTYYHFAMTINLSAHIIYAQKKEKKLLLK